MTLTTESEPAAGAANTAFLAGKYLTFVLGREGYGITVLKIREIIQRVPITSMPNMPDYIKGVINLRGKIIPVVDLRMRFGMPEAASTDQTCIIVVNVTIRSGSDVLMGLIVDAVEEVLNLTATDIEKTPDFGAQIDTTCILGMAKIKGAVKALLDIDHALGSASCAGLILTAPVPDSLVG